MRAHHRRLFGYVVFGLIFGLLISATTVKIRINNLSPEWPLSGRGP